jgi:hypothetical protein
MDNYEIRVRALEAEGLTRSDAQAVVDAEEQREPNNEIALWFPGMVVICRAR